MSSNRIIYLNSMAQMSKAYNMPFVPCVRGPELKKIEKIMGVSQFLRFFKANPGFIDEYYNTLIKNPVVRWVALYLTDFIALERSGPSWGDIHPHWFGTNPYRMITDKGGEIVLFKKIGGFQGEHKLGGDVVLKGSGAYVVLYNLIFNELHPPHKVPSVPPELLTVLSGKTDERTMRFLYFMKKNRWYVPASKLHFWAEGPKELGGLGMRKEAFLKWLQKNKVPVCGRGNRKAVFRYLPHRISPEDFQEMRQIALRA